MTSKDVVPAFEPDMIDVRLFGIVSLSVAGRPVALKPKTQLLSAVLFLAGGQWIPADRLVRQVWDDDTPADPRGALQDLVRDLRNALDEAHPGARALVVQRSGTYAARLDPRQVDVHRFRVLLAEADSLNEPHGDLSTAGERYRQALDQWGGELASPGEPVAGHRGSWVASVRHSLESDHLTAVLRLLDVELRLGRHTIAAPVLAQLSVLHPCHERVAELYMRALCHSGQPTEAQTVFHQLRSDSGREPGERLQHLHQQIITGDKRLELPVNDEESTDSGSAGRAAPEPETAHRGKRQHEGAAAKERRSARRSGRQTYRAAVINNFDGPVDAEVIGIKKVPR